VEWSGVGRIRRFSFAQGARFGVGAPRRLDPTAPACIFCAADVAVLGPGPVSVGRPSTRHGRTDGSLLNTSSYCYCYVNILGFVFPCLSRLNRRQ
jgi:hypothetical protein